VNPEERKKLFEKYLAWRELKQGLKDLPPYLAKELMEFKYFDGKACKIIDTDDEDRTITFRISDETLDRYKEVMKVKGCQIENFRANPVVLWAHNRMQELPPIGNARWIKIEKNEIISQAEFAPTDFAMSIYMLYKKKFMHGVSVGFITLSYTDTYDDDSTPANGIIEKWDLLEYSPVPVPANPNALVTAYKSGSIVVPEMIWNDFEEWKGQKTEFCKNYFAKSFPKPVCDEDKCDVIYTAHVEDEAKHNEPEGKPEPQVEPEGEPVVAEEVPENEKDKGGILIRLKDLVEILGEEKAQKVIAGELDFLKALELIPPKDKQTKETDEVDIEEEKEEEIEVQEDDSQTPENSDEGDLLISEEDIDKVISTLREELKKDFIGEFRKSVLGIVD